MRSLKSNGDKNEVQVLKKLGGKHDFSLSPLAQLLAGTNRCLSWNKCVMQEIHEIMTILEKFCDT